MKIFSLQTKKHLAGWSIGLGAVIKILLDFFIEKKYCVDCTKNICLMMPHANCYQTIGWPFSLHNYYPFGSPSVVYYLKQTDFWLNLFFWILIVLIILSLIRYFRYRNKST